MLAPGPGMTRIGSGQKDGITGESPPIASPRTAILDNRLNTTTTETHLLMPQSSGRGTAGRPALCTPALPGGPRSGSPLRRLPLKAEGGIA